MSLLFRSKRPEDGDLPAATLRQRAGRDQIRREIASDAEYAESYDPSTDWSLELLALTSEGPSPRPGREYDPINGELVRPAVRPKPWFPVTKQNHDVHGGRIDTQLDSKKGGRDGQ